MRKNQFGSVFRSRRDGGPIKLFETDSMLPTWPDRRNPGNADPKMSAKEIMQKWDEATMRRYEIFMQKFYDAPERTPWKMEFMNKTNPDWNRPALSILKCKMELIKRLLMIKLVGPETPEDWILLFLYYDKQLQIPNNIENILKPGDSYGSVQEFINTEKITPPVEFDYSVEAPRRSMVYLSNMSMPGFGTYYSPEEEDSTGNVPTYVGRYRNRPLTEFNWFNRKFTDFPKYTRPYNPNWQQNYDSNSANPNMTVNDRNAPIYKASKISKLRG